MLNYATIQTVIQNLRMVFDIALMWILIYYIMKIVRNNSRTIQIFKGIVFVLVVKSLSTFFGFKTVEWMSEMFIQWGFLAVIIIFQPEIRSLLEKLGKSSVFTRISTLTGNEKEQLVDELILAATQLSEDKIGALITIEQSQSLIDYIRTGSPMNSIVTSDVLRSIFSTSTPIHDGAVIIQGDRISCASAYFPPTNLELPSRYGARHRAALGISEITDSITIVVSEETGKISIAEEGSLLPMNEEKLRAYLNRMIIEEEVDLDIKKDRPRRGFFTGKAPVDVVIDHSSYSKEKTEAPAQQKASFKSVFDKLVKTIKKDSTPKSDTKSEKIKPEPKSKEKDTNPSTISDKDTIDVEKIETKTKATSTEEVSFEAQQPKEVEKAKLEETEILKEKNEPSTNDDQPIEVEKVVRGKSTKPDVNNLFESESLESSEDDNKQEGGES
jgi:diadenylate cyclase